MTVTVWGDTFPSLKPDTKEGELIKSVPLQQLRSVEDISSLETHFQAPLQQSVKEHLPSANPEAKTSRTAKK